MLCPLSLPLDFFVAALSHPSHLTSGEASLSCFIKQPLSIMPVPFICLIFIYNFSHVLIHLLTYCSVSLSRRQLLALPSQAKRR